MEPPRLIVTALREELAPLRRRLRGRPVRLACTGSGARRAGRAVERLLAEQEASLVIGAGVAGALTSGLVRGEVVVARCLRDRDGSLAGPEPRWLEAAVRLGAREVVAVTVDTVVTGPAERAGLVAALPPGAMATVDMESTAWSRAAARAATPCLVLRAISDEPSDTLPEYLSRCLDAAGSVSRGRVLAAALVHPRSLMALVRLRRNVRSAAERLAGFIEELIRS